LERSEGEQLAQRLETTSRNLEVLTLALVILVSPLSFVVALPFGIAPQTWLSLWVEYVFVFILVAIFLALTGFGAASSYRVRANSLRRSPQKR
jgi:membrane protein YdbS with pleckstrin-like domain